MPKMVKAKKDFSYSPNGIEIQPVKKDQCFACQDDLVSGLVEADMVEEVPEGTKATPPEEMAARETPGPTPTQPDISPIEHGGETMDRILTKEGQQPTDPSRDVEAEEAAKEAGAKALKGYEDKAMKAEEESKEGTEQPSEQQEQSAKGRKGR